MDKNKKYEVKWKNGKAHLIKEDGKTMCDDQTKFKSGWAIDEPATPQEFLKEVKPKCGECRDAVKLSLAVTTFLDHITE